MNIEEIALRVCKKLNVNGSGLYEKMVIEAAQAELSKDAEPSAYAVREVDNQFVTWDFICGWPEAAHEHINEQIDEWKESGEIPPIYSVVKLYEHPAPVIASEQKPVAWVDVIDRHEGPYNFNGLELLDSGKHLLFTSPPNTADIEQRVAEACANVLERLAWRVKPASANEVAEELRSGKWREYP